MKAEYQPHPLSLVFPRMAQPEMEALKDSIQRSGLREAIVIHEGLILDGLNRYTACTETKTTMHFREFGSLVTDGTSPAHFVADKNLHHRHLSAAQRAAAAEEMIPFFEAEAMTKSEAVTAAATTFGVSESSVKAAGRVKAKSPAKAAELKAGGISLHAADTATKAEELQKHEEAEAQLLIDERSKHVKEVEKQCGEVFADAFSKGTVLKTVKEMNAFLKLPKEDKRLIIELLVRGWHVDRALKFMLGNLDGSNTLAQLVLQTASLGKPVKVIVDGYVVVARKAVDADC